MATTVNIALIRGDTNVFEGVAKRRDGAIINLTGAKVWFTLKNSHSDLDVNAVLAKDTVSGGVTIVNALAGSYRVTLSADDCDGLVPGTELFYDVQVKEADNTIGTPVKGRAIVDWDVTRAIT